MTCGPDDGAAAPATVAHLPPGLDEAALVPALAASIPHLRRFLRARIAGSAAPGMDVDDIVQETLLRALRRLDELAFEAPNALLAYLQRIASNLVIDAHRRSARRPALQPLDDNMAARGATPLDLLLKREGRRHAARRFARLRPEIRKAVLLRVRGERDFSRLAAVMGRPTAGAARIALDRALSRIVLPREVVSDRSRRGSRRTRPDRTGRDGRAGEAAVAA